MKFFLTPFLLVAVLYSLNAQQVELNGTVNASGLIYSNDESPFWMYSNQRGRIDEQTNFSGFVVASGRYVVSENAFLQAGVGALYQDGFSDELQLDEAYLSFSNSWLGVVVGRKQQQEFYRGLSATNKSILWSLNARPLPGLRLFTTRPVFFKDEKGLGFEASYEEYFTDDERFVENSRIHHKSFHLVYRPSSQFQITAGLRHFVQWGGVHPSFGELPSDFEAYTKVITGRGIDGATGDGISEQEVNGLGNHLGSYEVKIKSVLAGYNLELIYNHLFEDGSGRVLRNTPDGRYGIFLEDPMASNSWIQAVMYELYYTRNQSKNTPTTDGEDNYFNNNLYKSGWTYENRILGVPFITLDSDRFRVNNNKIIAHHIGLTGLAFEKIPYKFLGSFRKNYGAKGGGNLPKHHVLSTYLNLNLLQDFLTLDLQLGGDFSEISTPNFGAGISLSKSFF